MICRQSAPEDQVNTGTGWIFRLDLLQGFLKQLEGAQGQSCLLIALEVETPVTAEKAGGLA